MNDWVDSNTWWLGYAVMAFLGGAIGHQLSYEDSDTRWTWSQHVGKLLGCWTKATFIAFTIFWLAKTWAWDQYGCFVATGLLSIFARESIKVMYRVAMKRIFGADAAPSA